MRAVVIKEPGGPDVLALSDVSRPTPTPHEVLIEVAAAGVNRPDVLQRRGLYKVPADASALPGLEVSGTIVETGSAVSHWQVGDTVCALTHGGGYAEYVAAPETHCLPIPEGVDIIDAAGLPEAVFTVWHNMVERGDLKAGERVLIHGATSGIGVFAVQIAKALGAEVITTAGSDEKCAFGRDLGADLAVNYRTEDFAAIAKELGGLDVVLDMVAGDYPERTLPVMKPDGRYVIIAVQGGLSGSCPYAAVLTKRLMLTGSTLRPQSVEQKAAIARAVHTHVWPMIVEGRVKPVRDVTFALEHAADAHKRMESGAHRGKILLVNEG